ncbi:MAG: NAD(P)-dependent oxidoreductase [Victivallaceae bacterium]|nr:NAD(P)-dependent oxidoreductase [Victivallaceae bacterium]
MESSLKNIEKKRIFLSGGTGFFGKNLLEYMNTLNANGAWQGELYILSRAPDRFCNNNPGLITLPNLHFIKGDIRNFEYSSLPTFDYVIHAATETDIKFIVEQPDETYSVIVDGTRRILAMGAEKQAKRLLYISSGAVYGVQPPKLPKLSEDYPCNPENAYGKGKLDAENMCLASGIDTVIARCFTFVGPYFPLEKHFAVGNFISSILNDEDINIHGDGTPYRSYLYATDLAEWLLTILLKGRANEAYNVGSDEAISIAELAKVICKYSASGNTQVHIAKKAKAGAVPTRYVPDVSKAFKLGAKIKVSLEEAIKRTIESAKGVML